MGRSLVLMIITMLMVGTFSAAFVPKARAVTMSFHLYGNLSLGWGFNPGIITHPGPTIQVYQGDTVNLTLTSQDELLHRFFVDYNNNTAVDAGEPASSSFTGTITYSFVADTLGNFTYRCAFHPLQMFGDFKVWTPIPEFPEFVFLPLFMALTLLAVVVLKRRKRLQNTP
jgi:plastocyanin